MSSIQSEAHDIKNETVETVVNDEEKIGGDSSSTDQRVSQEIQPHEVTEQSAFHLCVAQNQGTHQSFIVPIKIESLPLIAGLYGINQNKPRIAWQDNNYFPHSAISLHLGTHSFAESQSSQSQSSVDQIPRPRPIKNSVYDPLYEKLGLPIDPHMRLFLAKRDFGNGNGF